MRSKTQECFLLLLRRGIVGEESIKEDIITEGLDWAQLKALAEDQGVFAFIFDALNSEESLFSEAMPIQIKLEWIADVLKGEYWYAKQRSVAAKMAALFHENYIRTYVLKGAIISECYPIPNHRLSSDLDCFLLPCTGSSDAWGLGNSLIESKGYSVEYDYYKHSTFHLPGLTVENHLYLTPFRGNRHLRSLEQKLQGWLRDDAGNNVIEGTWLYRPPLMVSTLFLIEHAYSHFLHEGLTWRHVLDWVMFKEKHRDEINWDAFNKYIEEFGFRYFFDSFDKVGHYLIGSLSESELSKKDQMMVDDIWKPLDLHKSIKGLKGKLSLAGSTLKARWKYCYFTNMNWMQALWIQVRGFLFEKNPKLD